MRSKSIWVIVFGALLSLHGNQARAQQSSPQRLTLQDSITLALKHNLSVRVTSAQVEEAEGTIERRKSSLLPHVNGDAFANYQNVDLSALGISFAGVPTVVGPFGHFDMRVSASQSLIDRHAYHAWKASERQEQSSKLDYQNARDLVIRQTAGLYLDAQVGAAEVQAAESRIPTSQALESLARDQHRQGLATAVDVVRAQVQVARDQQTLLVARDSYQTSLLALAHFLGMSPGTPLDLAEPLKFHHVDTADVSQVLPAAIEARPDYRSLQLQRESLIEQQKASRARYLPTLSVNGDYGAIGRMFNNIAGTGEVQGTVTVTFFDRDRNGEQKELQSRIKRLDEQIADLRQEIEQEMRKALLDLESSENQVTVTEAALNLAQQELELTQDRFRNGVTDNIEVVTAQSTLSAAQDDRIVALARHSDAVMALVRSLGATEKIYQMYLNEP